MKQKTEQLTLPEIVRRLGHMLAQRERRGDSSQDYLERKKMHDNLLRKLYKSS
jgi:hypothetical protein